MKVKDIELSEKTFPILKTSLVLNTPSGKQVLMKNAEFFSSGDIRVKFTFINDPETKGVMYDKTLFYNKFKKWEVDKLATLEWVFHDK